MKLSKLKKFLQIYFKRQRQATFNAQKKEIKMLWRAIKEQMAKEKAEKASKGVKKLAAKPKKDKKLEYDEDDE